MHDYDAPLPLRCSCHLLLSMTRIDCMARLLGPGSAVVKHADSDRPRCCADDVAASPSTRGWPGSQRASPPGHPRAARELLEPGSSSEQSDDEPAAFPQSPAMARATAQTQGGARNEERAALPQSPAGMARAQAQAKAVLGQQHGASTPRRGARRRLVPGRSPQQGRRSSQGDAEPLARPLTQLQRPAALMQLSPGTDADLQVHPRGADLYHTGLACRLVGTAGGFLCRWLPPYPRCDYCTIDERLEQSVLVFCSWILHGVPVRCSHSLQAMLWMSQ